MFVFCLWPHKCFSAGSSSSVFAGYIIEFMLEDLEAVPADMFPGWSCTSFPARQDCIKMEMQKPHSSKVKFISKCSYSRLNVVITSRKMDLKLPQTLISTSSLVCQRDVVMY
ncbi:hypothetical protein Tco_0840731 [Tanacetum coccineum]|uniref:Secreted protein n=1 Tax=Tanacetum coccineum TaxID=301880 RepID=A0ABQ5AYS7_9ASTR